LVEDHGSPTEPLGEAFHDHGSAVHPCSISDGAAPEGVQDGHVTPSPSSLTGGLPAAVSSLLRMVRSKMPLRSACLETPTSTPCSALALRELAMGSTVGVRAAKADVSTAGLSALPVASLMASLTADSTSALFVATLSVASISPVRSASTVF